MIQQKQILIVEDNKINREILYEILSNDYEVLEAKNGKVALEILQQNRGNISLILLDVMMPVMDGYTFLDIIKKDTEFSMIPVIVLTQRDSEADEIEALEHGANDFVPKPYRPQVILHRVASLISLRENAALVEQFQYDRLTGLYTKEFFFRKMKDCLEANPKKKYTILCIYIEKFQLYTDTFGRTAAEILLVEVAEIFTKKVGEDAICCRYSTDGLLCLVDREKERKVRKPFEKMQGNTSFVLTDSLSVKYGIYEITDPTISVEQMCDRAMLAVDSMRGISGCDFAVYDDSLREKLMREKELTDFIVFAMRQKQFLIYFQPKYSLQDGRMVGSEVVVRWNHPEWGWLEQEEFIPLFEKSGFISSLDAYVWDAVCKKLKEWEEKGYQVLPVSVKVSRAHIYRSSMLDTWCEFIQKYEIDPGKLHLEISECFYTENPTQVMKTVEELRKRGFFVEIDDFGSGNASLHMLSRMPIDSIKLDQEFIREEMEKTEDESLLRDMIQMAHRRHLNVVAVGVGHEEQKEYLEKIGCDHAQGTYFAEPLPVKAFEKLLI